MNEQQAGSRQEQMDAARKEFVEWWSESQKQHAATHQVIRNSRSEIECQLVAWDIFKKAKGL